MWVFVEQVMVLNTTKKNEVYEVKTEEIQLIVHGNHENDERENMLVAYAPEGIRPFINEIKSWFFDWLRKKKASTAKYYVREIFAFFEKVYKPIGAIVERDIMDYEEYCLHERNVAVSTVSRIMQTVKAFFNYADKRKKIFENPTVDYTPPKAKDALHERIITESEVIKMIALEENPRNHLILHLLYSSGMRNEELTNLTWKDFKVQSEKGYLQIYSNKTDKTRVIQLHPKTTQLLSNWRTAEVNDDTPIFISQKTGIKLTTTQIFRIVKAAAKRAGITDKFSPHWLRHAHASHSIDRGTSVTVVSHTLGHSDVSITSRYIHVRPGDSSSQALAL